MSRKPTRGMVRVLRTARNGGTDAPHRDFDVAACVSRDWIETRPSIKEGAESLLLTDEGEEALERWDPHFTELGE